MSDVRQYTRRPAAIPIDPALVVPTARLIKNRAEHVGKPPIYIAVDEIEERRRHLGGVGAGTPQGDRVRRQCGRGAHAASGGGGRERRTSA